MSIFTLTKGSKAYKAFHNGIATAKAGGSLSSNPYQTLRVISLGNWWIKGFNSVSNTTTNTQD